MERSWPTELTHRRAATPGQGSVVLIHGSSATSSSMHPMAKALSAVGFATYALDIRGHGGSGRKGQIAYIGQLEDDLTDFMHAVSPPEPVTLAGFSSGGGFAVRFGGQQSAAALPKLPAARPVSQSGCADPAPRRRRLDKCRSAPHHRDRDSKWIRGPRLSIRFRSSASLVSENTKTILTPEYSYSLAMNFGPQKDYLANLRSMHQPISVLIGQNDEIYYPDRFADVLRQAGKDAPVTVIPGVDHIHLVLSPTAFDKSIEALRNLRSQK